MDFHVGDRVIFTGIPDTCVSEWLFITRSIGTVKDVDEIVSDFITCEWDGLELANVIPNNENIFSLKGNIWSVEKINLTHMSRFVDESEYTQDFDLDLSQLLE